MESNVNNLEAKKLEAKKLEAKKLEQKKLKLESEKIIKESLRNKSNNAFLDFLNSKKVVEKISKIDVKSQSTNKSKDRNQLYNYTNVFKDFLSLDYNVINTNNQFDKYDKKLRRIMRNKRNVILNNILFFVKNKNVVELKKSIVDFESFYKKYYVLNDYSLHSLCYSNSDDSTKVFINSFLTLYLDLKSIK